MVAYMSFNTSITNILLIAKIQIFSEIIARSHEKYTLFNEKDLPDAIRHFSTAMNILIHPTMTVMTDDSFLNLRGKEALVNIYYNIYNTNLNHPPIFNNCHLSSVIHE